MKLASWVFFCYGSWRGEGFQGKSGLWLTLQDRLRVARAEGDVIGVGLGYHPGHARSGGSEGLDDAEAVVFLVHVDAVAVDGSDGNALNTSNVVELCSGP